MTNREIIEQIRECGKIDIKNNAMPHDIWEYVYNCLDSYVTYTSDCYDILQDAHVSDFTEYIEVHGCKTVSTIAYQVLLEEIEESDLMEDLEGYVAEYTCEECGEHLTECICDEE